MIFSHRITAIFITSTKIRSAVFSRHAIRKNGVNVRDWTGESLLSVLQESVSSGPKRVRVILGEEFSYVTSVPIVEKKREKVLGQAQELIPEKLEDNWDFKKERSSEAEFQVAAIKSDILKAFRESFKQAGLDVEAIEPQSVALARLLPEKGLFIFVSKDDKILIGIMDDGTVETTYITSDERVLEDLKYFFSYARKKFNREPEKIFISPEINLDINVLGENNIKAENFDFDPLRAVALKKNIIGEDWQVMNIGPGEVSQLPEKKELKKKSVSSRERILAVLFIIMLVAAGLFIFARLKH